MNQVTGGRIYRNIISTTLGCGMARETRSHIRDQGSVIAGMTGGRIMTGGRTVVARSGDRIGRIVMDRGLAVSSGRMTAQTVAGPADHQGCIAVTSGAYLSRVIGSARVGMTEGAVIAMDAGYHAGAAVTMTVETVVSDQGVVPVSCCVAAMGRTYLVGMAAATLIANSDADRRTDCGRRGVVPGTVGAVIIMTGCTTGMQGMDLIPAIKDNGAAIGAISAMTGITESIVGGLVVGAIKDHVMSG